MSAIPLVNGANLKQRQLPVRQGRGAEQIDAQIKTLGVQPEPLGGEVETQADLPGIRAWPAHALAPGRLMGAGSADRKLAPVIARTRGERSAQLKWIKRPNSLDLAGVDVGPANGSGKRGLAGGERKRRGLAGGRRKSRRLAR